MASAKAITNVSLQKSAGISFSADTNKNMLIQASETLSQKMYFMEKKNLYTIENN
jgi:hypothetical protein